MMRALFTGASGMRGQQFKIDVTSNNLANVNTTGFKANRPEFVDLLYQQIRRPGGTSATGIEWPTPLDVGLGVNPISTAKLFTQGGFIATDQQFDMTIAGDGFFQVQAIDGSTVYTRDGSFNVDSDLNLVTSQGNYLIPNITIPENALRVVIGQDGTVTADIPDQAADVELGQITLVRFVNSQGLEDLGDNYYAETGASGPPIEDIPGQNGMGSIRQGYLENSNVSVVDELIALIVGQRAYEANSKSVTTSDEMLQTAVNIKR
jgi:flagellar basal-body rod protein FlgG